MAENIPILSHYAQDFEAIKKRVRAAQYDALKTVNRELVALYWDIGGMIAKRQKGQGWGKSVVKALSQDLQNEFPGMSGFSTQNLWYMRQFYLAYVGHSKLQPLVGEISWSKHLIIMARCKDDLQREFYMRMTRKYGWTKNVLAIRIQDQAYEKTMVGQNNFMETLPDTNSPQAKLAVRDEYTFDFLIKESNKPIGVASYRIVRKLPAELRGKLPDPKQIEKLLEAVELPMGKEDAGGGEGA